MKPSIDVIGAGAFGTALAVTLLKGGRQVTLWGRNPTKIAKMRAERANLDYLPDLELPTELLLTHKCDDLRSEIALLCMPLQALGRFLQGSKLRARYLVSGAKGLDLQTGHGAHQLIEKYTNATPAILSGPSFAVEIAHGAPTALVLGCCDLEVGEKLQQELSTDKLRLYLTPDISGVALGGAIKNVMAIAAGIVMGAGLGESARAAVVTRGFAEMKRFAPHFNALPETLNGLSGFGDIVLSTTSPLSRNFSYGVALGKGVQPQAQTTEGVAAAIALARIAKHQSVDVPLTKLIAEIVSGAISIDQAIRQLRERPLTHENKNEVLAF